MDDMSIPKQTEEIIADMSRQSHSGQQITFIESENATDMIAAHNHMSSILFGASSSSRGGVDVIIQSDGKEHYCWVSLESWEAIVHHVAENGLYPPIEDVPMAKPFAAYLNDETPNLMVRMFDRMRRG
jgi:hypothetical protein